MWKIPESSLSLKRIFFVFRIMTLKFVYFVQRCLRIYVTNMVSTNKVVGSGILLFFCSFLFSEEKLGENNLIRGKIVL